VTLSSSPPRPSLADSVVAARVLAEALQEYWKVTLPQRPTVALANGILLGGYPELSFESARRNARSAQAIARALADVDVDALSPGDYLTVLALRWDAESRAEEALFYWSDFSILSPARTELRDALELLASHPLASVAELERYLYLLEALPFQLARVRGAMAERRERGYNAPREVVASGVAFLEGLRALGDDAPWHVSPARLGAIDSTDARAFLQDASESVRLRLLPSLDSLADWLERDYLAAASERPGLWQYPGGKEQYRHLLRRNSSLDILPEEAHQVGIAELRRVDSLLAVVRTRLGVKGTVAAFHDSLRRATEPMSDSVMVAAVRAAQARIAPLLTEAVGPLPGPPPTVAVATPIERLLHPDGAVLDVGVATGEGRLVLTPRWRTPGGRLAVASRTWRLSVPGRALQRASVLARDSIPAFRRLNESRAFVDGWKEYAASLAGELGMYQAPLDAYGRLLDEGFAAALLVVDTGVHYLGWTRPQALGVLRRYTLEGEATVDSIFVERVVNDPGAAGAATLGAREFAAQRDWMRRELGASFDRRAWHEAVLAAGALPLPVLATHMEQWLYETRRHAALARDSVKAGAAIPPKDTTRLEPPDDR